MRLIADLIKDWKARREIKAAAKREMMASFAAFIEETRPLAPRAEKYPEAALYRHAWKRAVVLEDIAVKSNSADDVTRWRQFQEWAGENYYGVAPSGPYGKVRLALNGTARLTLRESESARIAAEKEQSISSELRRPRGVVYLLKSGPNYKIGRSADPDRRLNEVKLLMPDPVTREHMIYTNNPDRLEKWWHERFATKRKQGEWFGLEAEDVAEFKKHSWM